PRAAPTPPACETQARAASDPSLPPGSPAGEGRSQRLIAPTLDQVGVGIDAPVAQEGPVLPRLLDQIEIARGGHRFFLPLAATRQNLSRGIGDETVAPELDAIGGESLARGVGVALGADAVGRGDEDAV